MHVISPKIKKTALSFKKFMKGMNILKLKTSSHISGLSEQTIGVRSG